MKNHIFRLSILLLLLFIGLTNAKAQDYTQLTSGYFVKVTSQDEIVDGGQYLIIKEESSKTYAASTILGNNKYITAIGINTTGYYLGAVNSAGNPYVYTLQERAKGGYSIMIDGQYLVNSSGSTTLVRQTSSYYSSWDINLASKGFTIIAQNDAERRVSYSGSNNGCFANYKSTSDYVQLYKYQTSPTISISAACTDGTTCYSTYSNESAFIIPSDLTVSTVGISDEGKLIVNRFNPGDIVPANTGVMVSGSAGEHAVALTTNDATTLPGINNLHPSSEQMTGDCLFYRLTMHNGTEIGYWWGAEDGGAFSIAANKAYLAVPKSASTKVRNLWFDEEELAIKSYKAPEHPTVYHDLSGRRVTSPTKGIYIANGKKVMIR